MRKNKFFLCFRPVYDEVSDDVDCYILLPKMDSNSLSGRKSSSRRSFSGALKSILPEKSLSKRFRRRSSRGVNGDYCDQRVVVKTEKEPEFEVPKPELSTLSPSSSLELESNENQKEETKTECRRLRRIGLNNVMWLLLVSLWVNVLMGKLVAVILTTFWIYFVGFYSKRWKIRRFDLLCRKKQ